MTMVRPSSLSDWISLRWCSNSNGSAWRIHDSDVLPFSRGHAVLTSPPYPITDARVGVNLRWYLANSVYRKVTRRHADPQKVVFLSIHADSLHPSLRGAMAYLPAADLVGGRFGKSGGVYAARKEVQEAQTVSFSREHARWIAKSPTRAVRSFARSACRCRQGASRRSAT